MDDEQLYSLTNGELEDALKACRDYLGVHPAGRRAVRVAWMIAEAFQGQGRADDAIVACREFIAGKGYALPAGEAANTFDDEIRATPATLLKNLKMRALYRIGQILAEQKKQEEAIATWQSYVKEFPNGPEWSKSQGAIINAEFEMGMDALTDRKEALAMERFNAFLSAHPLDERAPRILYLFGAIHEAKALESEESNKEENKGAKEEIATNYRKAIEEWAKLVSKYPESSEATAAMIKSAGLFEEKLGEWGKALKLYEKVEREHHQSTLEAVARMTQKSLQLSAERVFRTNEKATVKLKLRNIEQCEVRLYRIDLQAYFRKMHGVSGVEGLDVSLIQPDKTWTLKPANYAKYRQLEQDVEIPFKDNEAGAYVVTVGDDDWESTVLVMRSDLEMVVKSSRREVLAFVQNMLTGKPASGVELLVSNGREVAASGKTGADGVFKTSLDALKDLADVRVFALRAGHSASFNLPLEGLNLSSGLKSKGYLYTDRPAYLPGETVSMRGIVRDVKKDSYIVPEQAEFKIQFADPQGRLLSEQAVKLSKFGTFDAVLVLPESAAVGRYTMTATQEIKGRETLQFQGGFNVRMFKLEKIKLSMEFPRRVWFRGEKVEAHLQAAYYWGEPLVNRVVRCVLPDRRIERLTTDAEGKPTLSFDTTGMKPGSELPFSAEIDGENVAVNESVTLAHLGYEIAVQPSQPVVIAGELFDVALTTTGADGKPTGETLKITVLRQEKTKTSRILGLLPWTTYDNSSSAEVKESELEAKTDPITGKTRVTLKMAKGGDYTLRVTGSDRFRQTITEEAMVEVSANDDENKLRFFADDAALKVGQECKVRLHSRLEKGLALLTFEGENILRYQIVELHRDYNEMPFKVGHGLFPNFRLAAAVVDGRSLRTVTKEFSVERELRVVVKPLKDSYLPGEQGKVELSVTDQLGAPVEAELSLALVNEALYAVNPQPAESILEFFQNDAQRHAEFHVGATCGYQYPGKTRATARAVTDEKQRLTREESEKLKMEAANKELNEAVQAPGLRGVQNAPGLAAAANSPLPASIPGLPDADASRAGVAMQTAGGDLGKSIEGQPPRTEVRGEGRWLPAIITGADGKAVVTIPMPETTTAWRLTARGCSVDTLVGEATAATLTRKDFFVELKVPAFLREGDEVRVVGRIHNLTSFAGSVPLTLKVYDPKDPTKPLVAREKTVTVKAMGGAEVTFDALTIPNTLHLSFELGGNAGDQKDSLRQEVPVQPWGLPYAAHAGGSSNADTAAVLTLPEGRVYTSQWMAVAVGPDMKNAVLDMALRSPGPLGDYARLAPPVWGNHPANDLLAVATALAYANHGKAESRYPRQLAEQARALVAALVASQAANGSWNSGIKSEFTTARAFWALVEARNAGIAVNKGTLDKAAEFLLNQLKGLDANDNDNKAIILHALSADKLADFAACNRVYRDRNTLGSATLAYITRAFFNIDRKEIAAELANLLEAKVKAEPKQPLVWESGYKMAWLNDTPETTALVLLALAESKPDSTRAGAAADSLLQFHGCFGYQTGRARGVAVAALASWFGRGKEQATDLEIAVQVNGREVGVVKSTGANATRLLEVPVDALKAGQNVVEFKARGRGRYAYAADLFGFSPDTTSNAKDMHPSVRSVEKMHAPLEYRGRSIPVASTSPVKQVENGQRVNVRLSDGSNYSEPNRWFTMEIALPAGGRLVADSLVVGDRF